jgi:hypothetical protein
MRMAERTRAKRCMSLEVHGEADLPGPDVAVSFFFGSAFIP